MPIDRHETQVRRVRLEFDGAELLTRLGVTGALPQRVKLQKKNGDDIPFDPGAEFTVTFETETPGQGGGQP